MEYPYAVGEGETFMVRQDNMEWFQLHPRRTRNAFILHCVSGSAKIRRDMDLCIFGKDMEWTLLPDSVIQIQEPSEDFEVRYCVCTPALFNEITLQLPAALLDSFSVKTPYKLSSEIELEANQASFVMMQVVYHDKSNSFRQQIIVNVIRSFYLAFYEKMKCCDNECGNLYLSTGDRIVKHFWKLLLEHYREHRPVHWYASSLCISGRYFTQIFRKLTGKTPKQTIDDYIIMEIKIQLRSTNDSVQQIADRLNFSDQSVMGRFFKDKTGMSPQEYRRSRQ